MTTHSKHYPQWGKIESISSKVRNKTRVPTFTITIQHSIGSFGHSNQSRKRKKRHPNWKRRSKTLTVCRPSRWQFQDGRSKGMGTEWDQEVVGKVDPQKRVLCLAQGFLREIGRASCRER